MFNIFERRDTGNEVKQINPEEAIRIIEKHKGGHLDDRQEATTTVIVDVRDPHEFSGNLGHISNAILIPLKLLPLKIKELEHHKENNIIVVCRSGSRSNIACSMLKRHGFKNVYNLKGGMLLWKKLGLKSHNE